jgi:hypothetical protein
MKTETQLKLIKKHLLSGKGLTPLYALQYFGCYRLSARIHDLRQTMNIKTNNVISNGKRFARYTLNE